jgi:PleD family two-component response regulator
LFFMPSMRVQAAPRIQVIDDEATIRSAFRRPIGSAALDGAPESVVVDVRMPLADILAFVRQVRADPNNRNTPVTVITDEYVADNSVRTEIARLEVTLCLKPPGPEHVPQFAAALLMLNDEF